MQKVLRKRIIRELKNNLTRYLALGFLIVLCMFVVIGMVGAAETVIRGSEINLKKTNVEDGLFVLYTPLTKENRIELEEKGIIIEEQFYMDYQMEDNSIIRVFQVRETLNQIIVEEGRMPEKPNEILMEKRYCEVHGISVGSFICIGGNEFCISGIGCTPDYDAPLRNISDSAVNSQLFGTAFVIKKDYDKLKKRGNCYQSESYTYAYYLNGNMSNDELKTYLKDMLIDPEIIEDEFFRDYWSNKTNSKNEISEGLDELLDSACNLSDGMEIIAEQSKEMSMFLLTNYGMQIENFENGISDARDGAKKLSEGIITLDEKINEVLDKNMDVRISNLVSFLVADDNPRIRAAANDKIMKRACGLLAGVIVMLLLAYVVSVFVVHNIEQEKCVIGALYALGVRQKDLIIHYLTLPVLVTIIFSVIGTCIGVSDLGIAKQMEVIYDYFSVPYMSTYCPFYLLIYAIGMPTIMTVVVNFLVIKGKLNRPVLQMIKSEKKENHISKLNIGKMGFINAFSVRQILREIRALVIVILGLFCALLITMLSLNCFVLCDNLSKETEIDTKFQYMYTYKYPDEIVPDGGTIAYAENMKKEMYGYNFDVTILGIEDNNPYFDVNIDSEQNKVIVSSALSQKYQIAQGDKMILSDDYERDYVFTVEDVYQYAAGYYVFMDIDSMRELFDAEPDYYNVVFSDRELDIHSGKLYAITTKDDIEEGAKIFGQMIMPMFYTLISCSVIIFVLVMYLMVKVMIERSSLGISLLKVFGYRKRELKKLYLNGIFYVVIVGAILSILLAKLVIDRIFPIVIANAACGMNLEFSRELYVLVFVIILALYIIIERLLVAKLDAISLEEVLKNRE